MLRVALEVGDFDFDGDIDILVRVFGGYRTSTSGETFPLWNLTKGWQPEKVKGDAP